MNSPQIATDTLFVNSIQNETYLVASNTDYAMPIIVISRPKEYELLSGYFTISVTNNKRFTIFIDGEIAFLFDSKSKKLKKSILKGYRSFRLKDRISNNLSISTHSGIKFAQLPELKIYEKALSGNLEKQNDPGSINNNYELIDTIVGDKGFKLLGVEIKDLVHGATMSCDSNILSPKGIKQCEESKNLYAKYKKEEKFAHFIATTDFYPLHLQYIDKSEIPSSLKLDRDISNYTYQFWENNKYNTLFSYMKEQFKDKLEEQPNVAAAASK